MPGEPSGFQPVPPPPGARPAEAPLPELGGSLHPAAIGVWSTTQIGGLVVLLVLNPASIFVAAPILGVLVVASVVRWSRFRWELRDGVLVIEQGLISRRRRVIPVERIQSVDLVRRIIHRLFGVVGVHVEAIGGGGDTEGQLDALSLPVAAQLRGALLAGRAAARGASSLPLAEEPRAGADQGELLASTTPRTLVTAGLTEANATLIAGLIGLLWEAFGDRIDEVATRLPSLFSGNLAVVAALAALIVAAVLLVGAQLLAFWGFTLHRDADELRIRRGLLEHRFDTIPLRRLQALRIEENVPRRLLGRASVKADVAGKPGGGSGGTDTLLPLGAAAEARHLVERILDLPGVGDLALEPMPRRARSRRMVRALLLVGLPTAVLAVVWDPRFAALALLVLPALWIADASYCALGHVETTDVVVVRAGWWVRRTAFVPTARLQALVVDQALLQRPRRLATLRLGIARSPGLWSGPQMIDVDRRMAIATASALAPLAARRSADRAVAGGGRRIRTFEG